MKRNSLCHRCAALCCALMLCLCSAAQDVLPHRLNADGGTAVPQATDSCAELPPLRSLAFETASSMPSSFRNRKENVVANAAALRPAFDIVLRGERPLRVLHLGDSHVAGKAFPNAVEQTLRTAFRKAEVMPDDDTDGLVFTAIGSNGATSERFLSESYRERIAATQADLVIVSLGTNEAHGMGYIESVHEQQLSVFLDMLRSVLPEATFLFTTPPGDYLKQVYVNYRSMGRGGKRRRVVRSALRPNPMNSRCAACITAFARDHDLASWDLYNICGGEAAVRNWIAAGLMRPDRVHYEPQGYAIQGKLLAEALIQAVGAFCKR